MGFCQSRILHLDPELILDDVQIEVVPELNCLGLLSDPKLLFIRHVNYLGNKCQKVLNLLRVVSSMEWGADRNERMNGVLRPVNINVILGALTINDNLLYCKVKEKV